MVNTEQYRLKHLIEKPAVLAAGFLLFI